MIGNEPDLEFFRRLPTVWDDTRVIHGAIGQYAAIARRRGQEWFVGAMTDSQARRLPLPLDFLADGRKYSATIYSDDPTVETRTHLRIDRTIVNSKSVLDIRLAPRCGEAIHLTPE